MKGIFSIATFVTLLSAVALAAPLAKRTPNGPIIWTQGADFIRVTDEVHPDVDQLSTWGTQSGVVQRFAGSPGGSYERDSYISFTIPALDDIPGATESSTCDFVIKNPGFNSGGTMLAQLFSLGTSFTETQTLTFYQHPYFNQYMGSYQINQGTASEAATSTPLDVFSFPCTFGGEMQFALRPQGDSDSIVWGQNNASGVGAFIEVRN